MQISRDTATNTGDPDEHSRAPKRKPARPGTSLAMAFMFVLWGVFAYLYPQVARLPAIVETALPILSIACFALGILGAAVGTSDLTDSKFLRTSAFGIAFAVVACICYSISLGAHEGSPWSTIWSLAVIPLSALAIMFVAFAIPELLEERTLNQRNPTRTRQRTDVDNSDKGETVHGRNFERLAELMVAALGVVAAVLALLREHQGG